MVLAQPATDFFVLFLNFQFPHHNKTLLCLNCLVSHFLHQINLRTFQTYLWYPTTDSSVKKQKSLKIIDIISLQTSDFLSQMKFRTVQTFQTKLWFSTADSSAKRNLKIIDNISQQTSNENFLPLVSIKNLR